MNDKTKLPAWWRPVWICLAGEQAVPNVSPLLPYPPEKVVYTHTQMRGSQDAAKRCKAFFNRLYPEIHVDLLAVPSHDMAAIQRAVATIIEREGSDRTIVNWTGGTKPMSFAALLSGQSATTLYFDSREGLMINLDLPDKTFLEIVPKFSIKDLIQLNADIQQVRQASSIGINAPQTTALLSATLDRELSGKIRLITALKLFMQEKDVKSLKGRRGGFSEPRAPLPNPLKAYSEKTSAHFLKAVKDDGLMQKHADGRFLPTAKCLDFLEGLWWEAYVGGKMREGLAQLGLAPDREHMLMNLEIKWPGPGTPRNEFDVVFTHNDRLYLISCTTASEGETEKRRNQVEHFADRLGGRFARAMIACTLDGNAFDKVAARRGPALIMPRLEEWLDPKTILDRWFKM